MKRTHPRQLITALLGAGLLIAALVPAASAAPPKWSIIATPRTDFAEVGSAAAFDVTITNNGPSNISSLFLLAFTNNDPNDPHLLTTQTVYVESPERPDECALSNTGLLCDFEALGSKGVIHVTVAYTMPEGGLSSVFFGLNTTGLVLGENNSHGDAKFTLAPLAIEADNDPDNNRGGKFLLDPNGQVFNSEAVSKSNVQGTRLLNLDQYVGATVEDGSGISFSCPKAKCKSKLFGEWSDVNVNNGQVFLNPFSIQITVSKTAFPANLDLSTVFLYHVTDKNLIETLNQPCPAVIPPTGCIESVTLDAQEDMVILAKVFYNGGYKGAY